MVTLDVILGLMIAQLLPEPNSRVNNCQGADNS